MTRINANINPADLIDQHLLAEYREIIRIPNVLNSKGYNINKKYPTQFLLGTGHVLYFYNKIKFLHKRFLLLKQELNNRNTINNIDESPFLPFINNELLYNDIDDNDLINANKLIVDRISDRILTMKKDPTINKIKINRLDYINNLKQLYGTNR